MNAENAASNEAMTAIFGQHFDLKNTEIRHQKPKFGLQKPKFGRKRDFGYRFIEKMQLEMRPKTAVIASFKALFSVFN